jgi:predicted permease
MSEAQQAFRALIRRPAYVAATVATLAIVIGVNTAIFAAINATLFRPIGLRSGERTVSLYLNPPGLTDPKYRNPLHAIDLARFRERARTLKSFAAFTQVERVLGGGLEPVVVSTIATSTEMLRLAPEGPILGRVFNEEEESRQERLIVLSHGAWTRRFGSDPSVIGRAVQLDGEPYTIVGVMPRSFPPKFLEAEIWTPLGIRSAARPDEARTYVVTIAQLADGATLATADSEIRQLTRDLASELPRTHQGWTGGVISFREWQYGTFQAPLAVLFLAVVALLLIAATNIANLTLASVTARSGEMALRRAIGASQWRVMRLVFWELAIINAAGAVCAVAVGASLLPALLAIAPATTGALGNVAIDWRVAIYAFACAALSSVLAALPPALATAHTPEAINAASLRSTGSRRRRAWRTALLVAQTAISVALLASGGMLLRTLARTSRAAPGFDAANILTAQFQLPPTRYSTGPARVAAIEQVIQRIASIPGVTHSGATMNRFTPGFSYQTLVAIEHQPSPDGSQYTVQFRRITGNYFSVLHIPLLRGRTFSAADSLSTPAVAIVSASFANRFWPDVDPIGQRVQRGTSWVTVVGVVADVSDVDLLQPPEPTIYAAWSQTANVAFPMGLVVRVNGPPENIAPALRAAVAGVDPTLALDRIQPLETFLDDSLAPQRFRTSLMAGLAAVGLVLGAIGVAGVTARTIAERMPEFGVRLVLGCDARALWGRAIVDELRTVGVGAAIGVALAIASGRLLTSMLPGTSGIDTIVVAAAVALLVAAAALAAAIPAARLLRISPIVVLRT